MELDYTSRKLLRILCENGRKSVNQLSKEVGKSRPSITRRMRFLEKELGLVFRPETNPALLGVNASYLICAKLRSKKKRELIKILGSSDVLQFAAFCRGEFDLLLYASAKTPVEYLHWEYEVRSRLGSELIGWDASQVILTRQGFFPASEKLLEKTVKDEFEKKLVTRLARNARAEFVELAKQLGTSMPKVRYHYKKLVQNNIVKRFTALMQKPPLDHQVVYFLKYNYSEEHEQMSQKVRKLIMNEEELQAQNTYVMVAETAGAYDGFDWIGFEDAESAYERIRETEAIYKGTLRTKAAEITEVIYGLWPIRSIDIQKEYDTSSWETGGK